MEHLDVWQVNANEKVHKFETKVVATKFERLFLSFSVVLKRSKMSMLIQGNEVMLCYQGHVDP